MTPLDTSLAYFRAWTGGDPDRAWQLLADDVVCHTPAGRIGGRSAVAAFMGPFAGALTHSELVGSHGDDHGAMLMYDTAHAAVTSAPAAELHSVRDGRIAEIRIIFDRLPFALARGEVVRPTPSS